jgi:hypothetical protein
MRAKPPVVAIEMRLARARLTIVLTRLEVTTPADGGLPAHPFVGIITVEPRRLLAGTRRGAAARVIVAASPRRP